MKTKKCNHISFWGIYKVINFNNFFSSDNGVKFKCENCGKKCTLKWKGYKSIKRNLMKRLITYFLWLLPSIILIFLVATLRMNFLIAIILIIIFHFLAMYYIINSDSINVSEK